MTAIFPLQEAQNNNALIRHTCHLYRLSLIRVLPLSLLMIAIYHLLLFGKNYIPALYQARFHQLMMFIVLLALPLFSMIVLLILQIGEQKSPSYLSAIKTSLNKFLSLVGCLISMILLPLIVLTVGIICYFLIGHFFSPLPIIVFAILEAIIGLGIFLALIPKIIAPILLFSEDKDANSAVEAAEQSTKMAFGRTILWMFYGFALLGFIAISPGIFGLLFKKTALNPMILEWVAEGVLVIILPWVMALWVMQAKDLYFRWEQKKKSETPQIPKPMAKATLNKDNNITF